MRGAVLAFRLGVVGFEYVGIVCLSANELLLANTGSVMIRDEL